MLIQDDIYRSSEWFEYRTDYNMNEVCEQYFIQICYSGKGVNLIVGRVSKNVKLT